MRFARNTMCSDSGQKWATRCLPLGDIQANTFLIQLADAGLGNFGNKGNLRWYRPLVDAALIDKRLEVFLKALGIQALAFAQYQQGKRPLAPLRIDHTDHRYFTYCRVTADQVFQLQGGNPLAAGLDHILNAVANIDKAEVIDGRHVTGVQPAVFPKLCTLLRLTEIALSQPRRTQHQLALCFAISR